MPPIASYEQLKRLEKSIESFYALHPELREPFVIFLTMTKNSKVKYGYVFSWFTGADPRSNHLPRPEQKELVNQLETAYSMIKKVSPQAIADFGRVVRLHTDLGYNNIARLAMGETAEQLLEK
jgi:hypothetical protein